MISVCFTFSFLYSSFTCLHHCFISFLSVFINNLDPESAVWLPGSLEMDLITGISEKRSGGRGGVMPSEVQRPFVPLILIFLNQILAKTLSEVTELTKGRSRLLIMEQPWTLSMT